MVMPDYNTRPGRPYRQAERDVVEADVCFEPNILQVSRKRSITGLKGYLVIVRRIDRAVYIP